MSQNLSSAAVVIFALRVKWLIELIPNYVFLRKMKITLSGSTIMYVLYMRAVICKVPMNLCINVVYIHNVGI